MDRFVKLDDLPYSTDGLSAPAHRVLARVQQASLRAAQSLRDADWDETTDRLKEWWIQHVPWHVTLAGSLFLLLELTRRARRYADRRRLYRAHLKRF